MKPPYAASFFISIANQEYIDEKVPELGQLRECVSNISQFDFTLIHNEINSFPELKDEIVRRFPHVPSYKLILDDFCKKINQYQQEIYLVSQELDQISTAIMAEDVMHLQLLVSKHRIENVAQVNLRVHLKDSYVPNTNLLSFALHYDKAKCVEYFLDNDMIDINTCGKESASSWNQTEYQTLGNTW